MKTAEMTTRCVRLDWTHDGRPEHHTYTIAELRENAAYHPHSEIDRQYSIDLPGGPIWHVNGRTNWSDPATYGTGRVLRIDGDLNDLVDIAEAILDGKTFEEIHGES